MVTLQVFENRNITKRLSLLMMSNARSLSMAQWASGPSVDRDDIIIGLSSGPTPSAWVPLSGITFVTHDSSCSCKNLVRPTHHAPLSLFCRHVQLTAHISYVMH